MATNDAECLLSSHADNLASPWWWHALAERSGSVKLAQVTGAEPQEGTVVQSNCTIRRYRLRFEASDGVSVVVKQVDLAQNKCAPCT